jgi:hypothetical protein
MSERLGGGGGESVQPPLFGPEFTVSGAVQHLDQYYEAARPTIGFVPNEVPDSVEQNEAAARNPIDDAIPDYKKAQAKEYERKLDQWDEVRQRRSDQGAMHRVGAEAGPRPKGETLEELRAREARRQAWIADEIGRIEKAYLYDDQKYKAIQELALKDQKRERDQNAYDRSFNYVLPALLKEALTRYEHARYRR